jgi:single-strand DNA-binding protein
MSVNRVILVGNLGKDPEVRHLDGGSTIAKFPLATSESYKDRTTGERVKQTEWHNIVLWRGLAEVAEKYLKKGNQVYIEGKLKTRSWDSDGVKKYITEVVADNMVMMSSKSSNDNNDSGNSYESSAASSDAMDNSSDPIDDLPF